MVTGAQIDGFVQRGGGKVAHTAHVKNHAVVGKVYDRN
jgi:hypothetical protein